MMTYEKYKDSGIDWLGDENSIPSNWKVERVKDQGRFQSGNYISALDIDEENTYPVLGGNGFRGFTGNYNHYGNYILIGRQGALCGNINYASGKFWATEHAVVVYKKKKINLYWLGELLRVMNLNQYSLSAAQPGLSVDRIKRLELPVPPLPEQNAISQYLDTKTQAIDKKVSLLKKKIEYYKALRKSLINDLVTGKIILSSGNLKNPVQTKDSGIDWIGQIPEHWEVKRLKSFAKTIKGKNLEVFDKPFENALPNLSLDYLRNDKAAYPAYCYSPNKSLKASENDILIVWDGAAVGEMIKAKEGFISSTIAKFEFDKTYFSRFFQYLGNPIHYTLSSIPTGMGIPHLNPTILNNFMCPAPPIEEQTEIAEYLDQKTETIDKIVKNILEQINHLKALRKTLINDVVTGKIRVYEPKTKTVKA